MLHLLGYGGLVALCQIHNDIYIGIIYNQATGLSPCCYFVACEQVTADWRTYLHLSTYVDCSTGVLQLSSIGNLVVISSNVFQNMLNIICSSLYYWSKMREILRNSWVIYRNRILRIWNSELPSTAKWPW